VGAGPKELTSSVLKTLVEVFRRRGSNTPTGGAERAAADLKGFALCRRPLCCWPAGFWMFGSWILRKKSLLKCVLARWFLDVSFQVTFFIHNYHFGDGYGNFWCPKPVIWQAWCLHFDTLGDHGTIQGPRLRFLLIFGGFRDLILRDFRAPWAICVFLSCLFPGQFFVYRFSNPNLDNWGS
jgi:hypothetical protein